MLTESTLINTILPININKQYVAMKNQSGTNVSNSRQILAAFFTFLETIIIEAILYYKTFFRNSFSTDFLRFVAITDTLCFK